MKKHKKYLIVSIILFILTSFLLVILRAHAWALIANALLSAAIVRLSLRWARAFG